LFFYILKTNKNQIISTLLKHYKVGSVKLKMKNMKDHAHYDVDRGELQLSTKYKTIKKSQVKEFLITILHEIYHAMDAKRYGWKKFKKLNLWKQDKGHIKSVKTFLDALIAST